MKKNILLTSSLVLCSLMVLPILAMDISPTSSENEYHAIPTDSNADLTEFPFLKDLVEELPEPQANAQEGQSNAEERADVMLQSVMLPTQEKRLGFVQTIRSICYNNVRNVIAYLSSESFDVENRCHFDMLNAAIQETVKNDDFDALTTILALCRSTDLYKTKIRIHNDAAQPTYKFLTSDAHTVKYDLNVQLANKKIEEENQRCKLEYNRKAEAFNNALVQLITAHRKDIATLSDNFDTLQKRTIEQAHAPMVNLAALNQFIRDDANNFVSAHPITTKANEIFDHTYITTTRLNRLDKTMMPKIEILSLTDK